MTPRDLARFESERRYATMVALSPEGMSTVTDETIELHDRILMRLFSTAKKKQQQEFHKQGKAINDKIRLYSKIVQALITAKQAGSDPFAAIEAVIAWDDFAKSIADAERLARPESFVIILKGNLLIENRDSTYWWAFHRSKIGGKIYPMVFGLVTDVSEENFSLNIVEEQDSKHILTDEINTIKTTDGLLWYLNIGKDVTNIDVKYDIQGNLTSVHLKVRFHGYR